VLSIKFTTHNVKFMKSSHEEFTYYTSKCFIADGPVPKTQRV